MEPTSAIALGIRAAKAVVDRFRYTPVGVVRTGSTEDRAQVYRRFLNAATRAGMTATAPATAAAAAEAEDPEGISAPFVSEVAMRSSDYVMELTCALQAIRLCAPQDLVAAAEDVYEALPKEAPTEFESWYPAYLGKQKEFLNLARDDLSYAPGWWQRRRASMRQQRAARRRTPRQGDRGNDPWE